MCIKLIQLSPTTCIFKTKYLGNLHTSHIYPPKFWGKLISGDFYIPFALILVCLAGTVENDRYIT